MAENILIIICTSFYSIGPQNSQMWNKKTCVTLILHRTFSDFSIRPHADGKVNVVSPSSKHYWSLKTKHSPTLSKCVRMCFKGHP